MYLDFTFKKFFPILIVVFIITGAIGLTFTVKNEHYGNIRLPTAFARWWQKESGLVKYTARSWSQNGGLLAAIGNLTFSKPESQPAQAQAVPVLTYHAIVKTADGNNVTQDTFADQMFALKSAGWRTITLEQLEGFLAGGTDLPARSVMITFDDGARDSFYPTDPIFEALGYKAVSFILPQRSDNGGSHYYLSEGEIRSMVESGRWEVGSHGLKGHGEVFPISADGEEGAYLANRLWLPDKGRLETLSEYGGRVLDDLTESRDQLEEMSGQSVTAFAFPFGEFGQLALDPRVMVTLKEISWEVYKLAFYQTWRGEGFSYNYRDDKEGNFMVKRIHVLPSWSGEELVSILEKGFPKDLPYQDKFVSDQGWFPTWGSYQLQDGSLVLAAGEKQTGAAAILDGTGHWRDYRLSVTGLSPNQTGVLLWVRMKDNDNNAACNFGNGFVHVEQTIDGERRVINGARDGDISIPSGDFTVAAEVEGRHLSCYLNGKKVAESFFLPEAIARGGIGLKVWDQVEGKSRFIAKSLTVDKL